MRYPKLTAFLAAIGLASAALALGQSGVDLKPGDSAPDFSLPGSDGKTTHFTIECTSINMMQRLGWRSNMIKAGDQVKATVAPLLSGQPGGLLLDVVLPDGRKLEPGVPGITTFKRTPEE